MSKIARKTLTAAALARREAFLVVVIGILTVSVTAITPLHHAVYYIAAVAILGLSVTTRLLLQRRRLVIEDEQESAKLSGRTRVPIESVAKVDPADLGIDPATQTILAGGPLPVYVPREIDSTLEHAIQSGLQGDMRHPIVIAVGKPKAGKSRALFEALLRCGRENPIAVIAPVNHTALKSLLDPGERPQVTMPRRALWLDDIEPFLNEGMTLQTLRLWHQSNPEGIVVATYGGKGTDIVTGISSGQVVTTANEVFQHARQIRVLKTNEHELAGLRSKVSSDVFRSLDRHGLAAYLVAAPALELKLETGIHALGEARCNEGEAVARAAIDWARCGRTDNISTNTLKSLWSSYLEAGAIPTDERFESGLAWALRPVAGTVALLQGGDDGYAAYDYIVRFVDDQSPSLSPPTTAWSAAIKDITDSQAVVIGVYAFASKELVAAESAFRSSSTSEDDAVAVIARFNLALLLERRGQHDEALDAYDESLRQLANTSRDDLAWLDALVVANKGAFLGRLGRDEEALVTYERALARFDRPAVPEGDQLAARVLVSIAATLLRLDRPQDALDVCEQILSRFDGTADPELQEHVARARWNLASALWDLDRQDASLDAYNLLLTQFSDADDSTLREITCYAAVSVAQQLASLQRYDESLRLYDYVTTRFLAASEAELRENAARAAIMSGAILSKVLDRQDDGIQAYEKALASITDSPDQGMCKLALLAAAELVGLLCQVDRREEAIHVDERVITLCENVSELELRVELARRMGHVALSLDNIGRTDDAIAAFERVFTKYGEASEPELREPVAMAMLGKALALMEHDRDDEAKEDFRRLGDSFLEAIPPDLHEFVSDMSQPDSSTETD